MNTKPEEKLTTGWYVVRRIVPFFGVMILANVVFAWFAFSTFTGIQVDNAYDKGINYNLVLEQARERELLGWQIGVEVENKAILITLFDKDGSLIEDADIEVMLFSLRSADDDQTLSVNSTSLGKFYMPYPEQVNGQWELRLKVNKEGKSVEYRRKLVLP